MNQYSKILLRFSAIFALIGAFIGSHMAGASTFEFLSVHAHILVVGWLSLFAFAVFYKVFVPANKKLAAFHVWTAIIGSIGLTVGMCFRYVGPFGIDNADSCSLIFFIVGGNNLPIRFATFILQTFMKIEKDRA